jgi:hypothetical protein
MRIAIQAVISDVEGKEPPVHDIGFCGAAIRAKKVSVRVDNHAAICAPLL